MLKKFLMIIVSIMIISVSIIQVYANDDLSTNNPKIILTGTEKNNAYLDYKFCIKFDFENVINIDNCEIIIHFNPNVLEYDVSYFAMDVETYRHSYKFDSKEAAEGKIKLSIKDSYKTEYYSGSSNVGSIEFKTIGVGDLGIYLEVIENVCKNNCSLETDVSALPQNSIKDESEINISLSVNTLNISGHGRVKKSLSEYDTNNVLPENKNSIEKICFEEGITEIYSFVVSDKLKEIWLPDSLEVLEMPWHIDEEIVVLHANGMTYAEEYASKYGYRFELNEGFTVGDLDSNGSHNAEDALRVLKMAAKIDTLYKWSADVDGSGNVDAKDALEILKIAAKL